MQGLHIIADLYNCPKGDYLTSAATLRALCVKILGASAVVCRDVTDVNIQRRTVALGPGVNRQKIGRAHV